MKPVAGRKPVSAFEPRRRARRRALQALYRWQINQDSAEAIIAQFREEQDFTGVEVEYFETLIKETIRLRGELDARLAPHIERMDADLDQTERAILRLGAYELLFQPEVPYRVVLDEAVELAHRFGAEQGHAFVNGVLDRLAAECRPLEHDRDG